MTKTINPVKATMYKFKKGDCGINAINDTCYGICAAFSGASDAYSGNRECQQACSDLVEEARLAFYGANYCDHHAPNRPVLFQQTPYYFPKYWLDGMGKKYALEKCHQACKVLDKDDPDCHMNCEVAAEAVVDEKVNSPWPWPTPRPPNRVDSSPDEPNKSNIWWTIPLALVAVMVLAFVVYKFQK